MINARVTPKEVKEFHTNDDVDSAKLAHHHTIGEGLNQAASGLALKTLRAEFDALAADLISKQFPVGHVILAYGTTPPLNYLLCNGSAFTMFDYPALAALLGGTNTPDYRDRIPVGASGTKAVGSTGGADTVTLAIANLPAHGHNILTANAVGTDITRVARGGSSGTGNVPDPIGQTGSGTAVNIQNKYLALNYFIKGKL